MKKGWNFDILYIFTYFCAMIFDRFDKWLSCCYKHMFIQHVNRVSVTVHIEKLDIGKGKILEK